MGFPHGHRKTTTFVAGLRRSGMVAPMVLDGPINGERFEAYVGQFLVPTLKPGDVLQVKVDALNATIPAAVKEIHPLGVTVLDASKYQVSLAMQTVPDGLLPGMRVTAYWG